MKIRDLWQRVGESRSGPRRRGSVLTNRPEVNVLDRPPNRLSVKAGIPLRSRFEGRKKKGNFRPSRDTRRASYRKFLCVLLRRQKLSARLKLFPFLKAKESINAFHISFNVN